MHALWLASWYPDRVDPFNGDFVQRHALALAGRMPVTVIHVAKAPGGERAVAPGGEPGTAPGTEGSFDRETVTHRGALTERLAYYRAPATPWPYWNKLVSQLRAFRAYRRAFRAHVRENGRPELIHVHVCMNAGLYALYLWWMKGIPFVVTEHYSAYVQGSPDDFYARSFVYRYFNRLILRRALAVHSVSRFLLEHLEKVASLRRTVVIPNAVDTGLFRFDREGAGLFREGTFPDVARPFRFIHVSSFIPLKNVPGILDAFALLAQRRTDWELVLVGPATDAIRAYGVSKGLVSHLRWVGEVPYATVADWLRSSDALVHFSWIENQPCVISEASCAGLPVVAAAVGGIPEMLDGGAPDLGLLVPSRDVEALTEALYTLMERKYNREHIAAEAAAIYAYEAVGSALEAFSRTAKASHS